jgi:hypothetical protein
METTPPPSGDVRFVLAHSYDSDDPEFLRGAEVGALEAKLELLGNVAVTEVMRRTNAEMVRRVAEGARRPYSIEPIDDTWITVTIDPAPRGTRSRNGGSLRSVD